LIPSAETLEERRLLSASEPFFKFNTVAFGRVVYFIAVSGPGEVKTQKCAGGSVSIKLVGTTQDSQLAITAFGSRSHFGTRPLKVVSIQVGSGRLGSIQGLTTTDLEGPISTLKGPVNSLQFDAIGPKAQINIITGNPGQPNVNGNLGQLTVNRGIELGPTGFIDIGNDLTGSLSVSTDVTLDGGQINIGRDLSGPVTIGSNLTIDDGGKLDVTRNLGTSAASTTSASSTSATSASSGSASGSTASTTSASSSGSSSGTTAASSGGSGVTVTGNVALSTNGEIAVSGNLSSFSVGGNLQTSLGGEIHVSENLGALAVTGVVQGKGRSDIVVGDDLGQLTILGGGDGVWGLQGANIAVTSNIQGVDIRNGIANSLIQAGFLITGGTPGTGSNSWNIGPDGAPSLSSVDPAMGQIAVLNSTIQAGYEIMNMTIGGDVVCDLPSTPTRIVAGETLQDRFVPNGAIDGFQIIGNLINSVLAASVGPNPRTGHYDKPAGVIEVGFTAAPPAASTLVPSPPTVTVQTSGVTNVNLATTGYPNTLQAAQLQSSPLSVSTAPPFANPADHEFPDVLPGGSINPSLAAKLQLLPPAAAEATELPLPSKSTVLGSVITTMPGSGDYAGIFAANTAGVLVGAVPTSEPVSPAP